MKKIRISEERTFSKKQFVFRTFKVLTCGAFAGTISRTLVAPLERIKTLQQTNQLYANKSLLQVIKLITNQEGCLGLLKGNSAAIAKAAPAIALEFSTYDFCNQVLFRRKPKNFKLSLIMGAASGFVSSILTYPLDLLRTIMMANSDQSNQQGIITSLQKIYQKQGIKGMFHGIWTTTAVITPFVSLNFTIFQYLKNKYSDSVNQLSSCKSILLGSFSGMAAMTIVYPLDSINKRVQAEAFSLENKTYFEIIQSIWKRQGILGFYSGLFSAILSIAPATGTSFFVETFLAQNVPFLKLY